MYMYCIEEWLLVCCRGHGWTGSLTQLMTTHTCGHCTPLPLSCRLSSVLPSVCDQRLVTWSLMFSYIGTIVSRCTCMCMCVCVCTRNKACFLHTCIPSIFTMLFTLFLLIPTMFNHVACIILINTHPSLKMQQPNERRQTSQHQTTLSQPKKRRKI